jgi:hypothetical protein
MSKWMRMAVILLGAGAGLALGPANCSGGGGGSSGADADVFMAGGEEIPLAQARIIFEFNQTANDLGVQVFLDGESWKKLRIISPDGKTIFEVEGRGNLGKIGLTELFFEGEEPSLDEVPLEEMLANFPAGEYQFIGRTVDGNRLVGTATLSHVIPDGPVIVSPDPDSPVDPANTVISWEPVETPSGVNVVAYQVIVGSFQVTLPASKTSVTVPAEFLEPGQVYLFEILAIEAGGNQTITESSFETE